MAEATKPDALIDVKPSHLPRSSFDCIDFPIHEPGIPFFKSRSRSRGRDTWIVSLFAILHIVAFIWTMAVNDCHEKSSGDCVIKVLGRLSFQPLSENPLLGPSASTLEVMGGLERKFLDKHQTWRLFTFPCLHAGFFHLLVNLVSVMIVGIHLEQEFGSVRIGTIYVLSGFTGSVFAALFVESSPRIGASGSLFGLLGAMLSGLIWNWKLYTNKVAALALIWCTFMVNFVIGMLQFVDNFANIGGFLSGLLLGFAILYTHVLTQVAQNKAGFFDYGTKGSAKLKQKLDKPAHRIMAFLLFVFLLAGCLAAVLQGFNLNHYCSWCSYVDCALSNRWSCFGGTSLCQTTVSESQMTLTCAANGNFRVFPFTDITPARTADLCNLICSMHFHVIRHHHFH